MCSQFCVVPKLKTKNCERARLMPKGLFIFVYTQVFYLSLFVQTYLRLRDGYMQSCHSEDIAGLYV